MKVDALRIEYLGVDALRVGHAAAIFAVVALVDVDAALTVGPGVVEADALHRGTSEAGRARVAAEPVHHVHAARSNRVARIGQVALYSIVNQPLSLRLRNFTRFKPTSSISEQWVPLPVVPAGQGPHL